MRRTTVEITPDQHQALRALAKSRRIRGVSALVREAINEYLQDVGETKCLMSLEGSINARQEAEMRSRIGHAKKTWRTP